MIKRFTLLSFPMRHPPPMFIIPKYIVHARVGIAATSPVGTYARPPSGAIVNSDIVLID